MKSLLITGPDSSLDDTYELALEAYPSRKIEKLKIPSRDYYFFDLSSLKMYPNEDWDVALAVNEFYINDVRRALYKNISDLGYSFTSLISPRAYVSHSAKIGMNSIIHPGCFIGSNTMVGEFCSLRPNVVLSENVQIGNFVTLEANVSVRENCILGDFVTICSGSSLCRGSSVGSHSYLNLSQQYSGSIAMGTFYSPSFEEPIHILGLNQDASKHN